jgi:hypothetical protein
LSAVRGFRLRSERPAGIPREIVCVDCGGRCHLLSHVPEEGFEPGDVVAYRCADCLDRWDIVLDEEDLEAT